MHSLPSGGIEDITILFDIRPITIAIDSQPTTYVEDLISVRISSFDEI